MNDPVLEYAHPAPAALKGPWVKSAVKASPSTSVSLIKTEVAPAVVVVAVPPSARVILSVFVTGGFELEENEPTYIPRP